MFVRKTADRKSGCTRIQICESRREGGKVKQKIVRHVGIARSQDEVQKYSRLASALISNELAKQKQIGLLFDDSHSVEQNYINPTSLSVDVPSLLEEARLVEGPTEVLESIFDEAGFGDILDSAQQNALLKTLVIERISEPDSKLGTSERSEVKLGKRIDVNRVYRMMDALDKRGDNVLRAAFSSANDLYSDKIDLICFDVTTLYFESIDADELRNFGYSKDQKFHSVQVTLALATTNEGVPIGYKLFPGNTAETKTLIAAVEEWRKVLPIRDVLFVADRGMFSVANLRAIVDAGFTFIVAAPLRKMGGDLAASLMHGEEYKLTQIEPDGDVWWVRAGPHTVAGRIKGPEGRFSKVEIIGKLVVSWSAERARKDSKDREKILTRIRDLISKGSESGAKKLISNSGYKKYAKISGKSTVAINDSKVEQDSLWDGLHGVFTNSCLPPNEILGRYRHLLSIEDSFRISKSDLKMRPIFHFAPRRVRAHIAICFLALCVVRRLQVRLARMDIHYSVTRIREALNATQASILSDAFQSRVRVPSKMTPDACAIYGALKIKRRYGVTKVD
jgi:transposase